MFVNGRRLAYLLPLALVVAWFAMAYSFWFLCDDSLISFRYARNLAAGDGLRYNLLNEAPVEGYSNFLWVVFAALTFLVGGLPEHVIPWISLASGAGLIALVWIVARKRLGLGVEAAFWATALVATAPSTVIWGTSGLETMSAALALAALFDGWVLDDTKAGAWRGALAGLALTLLRTEGIGWIVVVALFALAMRRRETWRQLAAPGLVVLGGYALYFAGRYAYFGTILSNTATAKIHISAATLTRGLQYVTGFALADLGFLIMMILAGVGLFVRPRKLGVALGTMAVGPAAYAVLVGGDFMVMGRLLLPCLPFAAWALGRVAQAAISKSPAWSVGLRLLVIAGITLHVLPLDNRHVVPASIRQNFEVRTNTRAFRTEYEQWVFQDSNTRRWRVAGLALKAATRPGDSYVLGAIGAVGYYSDLIIYDRYGLVTASVAEIEVDENNIHRSPGHDTFVPVTFFVDQKPTILYADPMHGANSIRSAPSVLTRWKRYARYSYAPTLTRTVVDGDVMWVTALRYFPDREASEAMWAAFEAAAPLMRSGKLPMGSPVIYPARETVTPTPSSP